MVQSYYGIPFVSVQVLCKFSYTPCVVLAKAGEIFIINFLNVKTIDCIVTIVLLSLPFLYFI